MLSEITKAGIHIAEEKTLTESSKKKIGRLDRNRDTDFFAHIDAGPDNNYYDLRIL